MNPEKRFKAASTALEQLPNELFVEIFAYLSGVDVVYSFSQLNIRIKNLILNYCHTFDFQSVHKTKFDLVIQQHNPRHWRSLRLSNDDETPGQIEYFLRLHPLNQRVSQLKSIAFVDINLINGNALLSQLPSLVNLVSLTIKSVCGECLSSLSLPSLKRLVLSSCVCGNCIMNFPRLESLEYTVEQHPSCTWTLAGHHLIFPESLKQLKISFTEQQHGILVRESIRRLSNLISLKICAEHGSSLPVNGQIWEDLIRFSLPSLEKFHFYFLFKLPADIDIIIASFSTPFYLYEKRWFIRYDSSIQTTLACLYSLPFVFEHFAIQTYSFDTSVTTLLIDQNSSRNMYKNITTLTVNNSCVEPHPTLRSQHVDRLILNGSHLPNTWLSILTKLRHLSLGFEAKMTSNNFTDLLANAPNLYHLTISVDHLVTLTNDWNDVAVCDLLSKKIRSLNLDPMRNSFRKSVNYIKPRELQHIARMFGGNCEHLTICLESHHIIETFILPYMKNLRSFNVSGAFDQFGRTFVMNSVEQWKLSSYVTANWHSFQIWS